MFKEIPEYSRFVATLYESTESCQLVNAGHSATIALSTTPSTMGR